METLPISIEEGKAEQSYVLKKKIDKRIGSDLYLIFESSNFFGVPVTFGVKVSKASGTNNFLQTPRTTVKVVTKASVCSESDVYKPALGRQIVMGRLLLAEPDEGTTYSTNSVKGGIETSFIETMVHSKAKELASYIRERGAMQELHKMSKTAANMHLREKFQQFK
jgi:hypothetical protein